MPSKPKLFLAIIVSSVVLVAFLRGSRAPDSPSMLHQLLVSSPASTLSPKESALLSSLMEDEKESFKTGGVTVLFNDILAVSAAEISRAYNENEVAADQKYLDQLVKVSGKIKEINSGLGNRPYITLNSVDMFTSTQIHFNNPNIEKIVSLKKHQNASFICKGDGAIVGSPMFKNCLFMDDYLDQKSVDFTPKIADFLAGGKQSKEVKIAAFLLAWMSKIVPENDPCLSRKKGCWQAIVKIKSANDKTKKESFKTTMAEWKEKGLELPEAFRAKTPV